MYVLLFDDYFDWVWKFDFLIGGIILFNFENWIVSIASTSLILSIFEIILPLGKMRNICKSVMGIYYIFVIILPIFNVLKSIL